MNKVRILLPLADIKEFIEITTQMDCDVDLIHERYVIDGKSLMGIFSLDLSTPVDIVIHSDNTSYYGLFKKWEV